MSYIFGTDVSWPNGNYRPGSEHFVFVGAVSLDGGSPFVQNTYHEQVSYARAAGKEVGHYAFNGRTNHLSPTQFADYFVDNLYDYRPGDALVLDVESSESGSYRAWTPSEAREFRDRVQSRITTRLGIYGNRSDMGQSGWGALHAQGTWLWIAWPGDESALSSIGEWGSDWQIWQYDSSGGLDKNYAKQTLAALAHGGTAPHPDISDDEEDDDMANAQMHYTASATGKLTRILFNPDSGFYVEWTEGSASTVANGFSNSGLKTGASVPGTQSMRNVLVASLDEVRTATKA